MNPTRAWTLERNSKYGGIQRLGERTDLPKDGQIPSADEARRLSEQNGKMMTRGKFIRSATRPA